MPVENLFAGNARRSISHDLTLSLVATVALVAAGALALLFAATDRQALRENEARAESYLTFLQETLHIPMWELNDQAIGEIGRTFAQNDHVAAIVIRDAAGRTLFSAGGDSGGLRKEGAILHDGHFLGHVSLSLSSQPLKTARRELLFIFAVSTLLCVFVLTAATGVLLRIFLRRPFEDLDCLVTAYAEGRYDAPPPGGPRKEFERLTRLLLDMGGTISRQVAQLSKAEAKYRSIFENAAEGLLSSLPDGRITSLNPAAAHILGYASPAEILTRPELTSTSFYIDPADRQTLLARLREQGETVQVVRLRRPDGEQRWIELHVQGVKARDGRLEQIEAILIDVTERRAAEVRLQDSLTEKEILLKEIHHRVKNNLQIVSSLLYLQSANVDDPGLRELFLESQGRIASMALVHEEIYHSKDLSGIELGQYASKLILRLLSSFGRRAVNLDADVSPLPVSLDTAIPCALILNELVTNACKHGFVDSTGGRLRLVVGREGDLARLRIEDDGPGLPENFDPEAPGTLGMLLIVRLTSQLKGTLETGRSGLGGASFAISFPLPREDGAWSASPLGSGPHLA